MKKNENRSRLRCPPLCGKQAACYRRGGNTIRKGTFGAFGCGCAAALGDIGRHFPDTDPAFPNINSRILLKKTAELLREKGFKAVNIDATVIAQKPKLAVFIPKMVKNIAADCNIEPDCVNVKATTEEGLGFTGSLEGIAAHAVCLIERI